jgi:hypothetical protein
MRLTETVVAAVVVPVTQAEAVEAEMERQVTSVDGNHRAIQVRLRVVLV